MIELEVGFAAYLRLTDELRKVGRCESNHARGSFLELSESDVTIETLQKLLDVVSAAGERIAQLETERNAAQYKLNALRSDVLPYAKFDDSDLPKIAENIFQDRDQFDGIG